jgi:hypothetical protein
MSEDKSVVNGPHSVDVPAAENGEISVACDSKMMSDQA